MSDINAIKLAIIIGEMRVEDAKKKLHTAESDLRVHKAAFCRVVHSISDLVTTEEFTTPISPIRLVVKPKTEKVYITYENIEDIDLKEGEILHVVNWGYWNDSIAEELDQEKGYAILEVDPSDHASCILLKEEQDICIDIEKTSYAAFEGYVIREVK